MSSGVSKAPSCSSTAAPRSTPRSGWSSGPPPESEVPLRSHGSLSLNRALMAAGLVDGSQLTIFPAITENMNFPRHWAN